MKQKLRNVKNSKNDTKKIEKMQLFLSNLENEDQPE